MATRDPKAAAASAAPTVRRRVALLGRSFAGTIATRLDAHAPTPEGDRAADERRILKLIQDVLAQVEPDACAVNFITQAVEMHTATYGTSRAIYDRLFELHEERLERRAARPPARRPGESVKKQVAPEPARPAKPKIPAFKAPPPKLKA